MSSACWCGPGVPCHSANASGHDGSATPNLDHQDRPLDVTCQAVAAVLRHKPEVDLGGPSSSAARALAVGICTRPPRHAVRAPRVEGDVCQSVPFMSSKKIRQRSERPRLPAIAIIALELTVDDVGLMCAPRGVAWLEACESLCHAPV